MADFEDVLEVETELTDIKLPTPFSVKTWKEDLTIVVEENELYVSKAILGSISPVFDRMFSSEFKEKTSDRLNLPDKTFNSFLEFLCCVYPGVSKPITAKNVENILPLVVEYQMDSVIQTCETLLVASVDRRTPTDTVYKYFSLALKYQLGNFKDRCIEIASEHDIDEMIRAKQKFGITSDEHEEVLAMSIKRLQLDVKEYSETLGKQTTLSCKIVGNLQSKTDDIMVLRICRKFHAESSFTTRLEKCRKRSADVTEDLKNEDEFKYLPSDIKDFITGKTSSPPKGFEWMLRGPQAGYFGSGFNFG